MTTRTTLLSLLAAAALMLSCGGDDDASPAADDGTAAPAATASAEEASPAATSESTSASAGGSTPTDPPTTTAPAASSGSGAGANVAIVTVGDNRYEIDVTPGAIQRCDPDFFGALWAIGTGDGSSPSIELLIPREGAAVDDPPTVKVTDRDLGVEWVANAGSDQVGIAESGSSVDSSEFGDNSVSGTATFVDLNQAFAFAGGTGDAPEPIAGTFEVSCSG